MNIFDDMPDIGRCPHCGHDGLGMQFAIPVDDKTKVQAACLSCGVHGPLRPSYDEAVKAFRALETEDAA